MGESSIIRKQFTLYFQLNSNVSGIEGLCTSGPEKDCAAPVYPEKSTGMASTKHRWSRKGLLDTGVSRKGHWYGIGSAPVVQKRTTQYRCIQKRALVWHLLSTGGPEQTGSGSGEIERTFYSYSDDT